MRFFDTNIFVYSVDPEDPAKRATAQGILDEAITAGTLVLSAQVMQEFHATVLRRSLLPPARASDLLAFWASQRVMGMTPQAVLHAIELQQQLRISLWDALVVRSALDAGCVQLVTEDLQHGMRIGDLEVVNPFLQPPAFPEPRAAYRAARPRRARAR